MLFFNSNKLYYNYCIIIRDDVSYGLDVKYGAVAGVFIRFGR